MILRKPFKRVAGHGIPFGIKFVSHRIMTFQYEACFALSGPFFRDVAYNQGGGNARQLAFPCPGHNVDAPIRANDKPWLDTISCRCNLDAALASGSQDAIAFECQQRQEPTLPGCCGSNQIKGRPSTLANPPAMRITTANKAARKDAPSASMSEKRLVRAARHPPSAQPIVHKGQRDESNAADGAGLSIEGHPESTGCYGQ